MSPFSGVILRSLSFPLRPPWGLGPHVSLPLLSWDLGVEKVVCKRAIFIPFLERNVGCP